ncbi:MAG: UDP-N-acetylglucosamine--N-acetylmuramyl-(pentapeptide) pyrophosphoryl-undecaprenol N-acetylglucosamine transferase [Gemmatimonadota bacterium]|nr:UDP-N-acetylglucosamine--N-acetylmuramyl-(pentapeptide) pyrophosphoryl-undecaprenol N-acetylglucosamine transferase [Gemmatimonadota bacterium]
MEHVPPAAQPPSRRAAELPSRRTVLIAGGGTGGHLMPALAIAARLRERRPDLEPVLVGATRGIEATLLPTRDFRYHLLPVEPLYRRQWWKNLRWPLVAGRLLGALGRLFAAERPVAVIGTGGYASGPAVWFATRRGIPTALQEQNAYPGLVTRLLARRVRQVYLGLPEARARLRLGERTEVFDTGNPIVPPDPARREAAARRLGITGERPVLLVTGGSQGAIAINEAVAEWIEGGGAARWQVLWATGRGSHERFVRHHRPPDVQVFGFLDPMADAYAVASLVVARAGMMTGAELCAWGLPSVLIPLPTSAEDHQRHNAEAFAAAGAARVILQRDLTAESLGRELAALAAAPAARAAMAAAARARGRPDALETIVTHLLTLF